MDWPFINGYRMHSKGRPRSVFPVRFWSLLLIFGFFQPFSAIHADSSPPVVDVEDLFKDEGFLRMSRGGEAFGGRRPPPIILNPPHGSTQQTPPRHFSTPSSSNNNDRIPPSQRNHDALLSVGGDNNKNPGLDAISRGGSGSGGRGSQPSNGDSVSGGAEQSSSSKNNENHPRPLEKDVNAVFSKVSEGGETAGEHPLLGITPAAPGEAFDFNPILSNPAVTRILAGSSGRIPQWEPTLPDLLHDLIPEVAGETTNQQQQQRQSSSKNNPYSNSNSNNNNNNPVQISSPNSGDRDRGFGNNNNNNNGNGASQNPPHNPKSTMFVPSPVSSKGSQTMYNMDQMTNNIAIPKHILPNPSNLATSRTTMISDDLYGSNGGENNGLGGGHDDHSRYGGGSSANNGQNNNGDGDGRDGESPYIYDDEEGNDENSRNSIGGTDAQGKRGIWKGDFNGLDHFNQGDENGPKYICDALCGAWKHQCKLMGILFSITSGLCLVFAIAILYSLHFGLKDFAPFSIILLFLFTTSASRAFILLSGWFCSPESRPTWLPIISTISPSFITTAILVALRQANFPFPFQNSYNPTKLHIILGIFLSTLLPTVGLSLAAHLSPERHVILSQIAWILGHIALALVSLAYLLKFKSFYSRLSNERGNLASDHCGSNFGTSNSQNHGSLCQQNNPNNNLSSLKKRGFVVKWGCLQARAMFGAALLAISLSIMIIISVSMSRGECEFSSTWSGWVLSLCARMLEFAIVILLLLVTISSADIRILSRLTRVSMNKNNVGLMNTDIFPTMVSSNSAVQRCIIPMYSSNNRADVMMLGPTEINRSSLRGKSFGERALPGERVGEYRSSVGRGLPLRLGNGVPSQSLPQTPADGYPPGLRLPEPAPASLLVTKVVFGTPAISREVNLNHQHENPLLCTEGCSKDEGRDSSNIYASLESVKVASSMPNAGSSTGSNHSGSDRVLLSAPRDYIYSISRDLTKTIDSIYDTSRPRSNNLAHTIESMCPPLGSIPNLSGGQAMRAHHYNLQQQHQHHQQQQQQQHQHHHHPGMNNQQGRTDLARTIERIRYAASGGPQNQQSQPTPNSRNFVLQLGQLPHPPVGSVSNQCTPTGHGNTMGNPPPPPYIVSESSESSHDVTPDSGIVSDIQSKAASGGVPDYAREYRRNSNSIEDVRRLPLLPLPKQHRTLGGPNNSIYDRNSSIVSPTTPSPHPGGAVSPMYIPNPTTNNSIVGRVEHLLNQTEHILSRTESLDSNSQPAGINRLLSHKSQLEHVERLLAQAEYAIWLEKRNCAQQVGSQLSPAESSSSPYGYSQGQQPNSSTPSSYSTNNNSNSNKLSANSANKENIMNNNGGQNSVKNGFPQNGPPSSSSSSIYSAKKVSKNLEEESVV